MSAHYRTLRKAAWILGAFCALLIVVYLAALCDEHYEARRAMRFYHQLLSVRLGDRVADFDRKVSGCAIGEADGEYSCLVDSITHRVASRIEWHLMHAHEDVYLWENIHRQKIGVRDWHADMEVVVHEGRVDEVHTHVFVVGRDEMLGCSWSLSPELGPGGVDVESKTKTNLSTSLRVTHITSSWSGSGYRMEFTPRSSADDLRMREINGACLTSFVGCRNSRELLPNLPPRDHPQYW